MEVEREKGKDFDLDVSVGRGDEGEGYGCWSAGEINSDYNDWGEVEHHGKLRKIINRVVCRHRTNDGRSVLGVKVMLNAKGRHGGASDDP